MNKQFKKPNTPVDKFSFQQLFNEIEFFPIKTFTRKSNNIQYENGHEKMIEDVYTSSTKPDSGFLSRFFHKILFVLRIHLTLGSALLESNPVYRHPKQTQPPRTINDHRKKIVEFQDKWRNLPLPIKRDLHKTYSISLLQKSEIIRKITS